MNKFKFDTKMMKNLRTLIEGIRYGQSYTQFPHIVTDKATLRNIVETDIDGLFEIY